MTGALELDLEPALDNDVNSELDDREPVDDAAELDRALEAMGTADEVDDTWIDDEETGVTDDDTGATDDDDEILLDEVDCEAAVDDPTDDVLDDR